MRLRLPETRPAVLRRLVWASLVVQVGIVVTGGAVRLTGSGLGCPTFPRCTPESLITTPEMGVHGVIEFGNRLLTWVLLAVAVATAVAAFGVRPRRRDLRALSGVLVAGIFGQALIGGISVLTGLNPWVVMLHFVVSAALISAATVLVRRADPPTEPRTPLPRPLRLLAVAVLATAYAAVVVGTVVTGSGPHAGDPDAPRTGIDVAAVSQLHADVVFLLLGLTVGLWAAAHAVGAPRRTTRAAGVLLLVELGQGLVGGTQYALGLPVLLVGLHLLGAALLVAAAVDAVLATRVPGPPLGPPPIGRVDQPITSTRQRTPGARDSRPSVVSRTASNSSATAT